MKKKFEKTVSSRKFLRDPLKRRIGLTIIGDAPWGTHFCQFYQTKEDLIEILVPYFRAGLENNEFCMWITSEPLRVNEAAEALQKAVKDLGKYVKKGQIEILDSKDWYTKSGVFNSDEVLAGWVAKEQEARKKGFDGLRLTGNTFWLEKKDWKDFQKYEEAVNSVIGNYHMIAICSYSLDRCSASEIIDVVSNHQFALIKREGRWSRIENPDVAKFEAALRESRLLMEAVFSSMNDAVVVLDKNGNIINFNEAFATICRFKNKEDCLRSVDGFGHIIEAFRLDGTPLPVEEWPAVRGLRGETGSGFEYLVKRKDTGESWISSNTFAPLYDKNGEIIGAVQTMHDVTDRKTKETQYVRQAQMLDQVKDGIIETDKDYHIMYWNKGAEQIFGFNQAEALGKTTQELLRPTYRPGERKKILDELDTHGTTKETIQTKHKNGAEIFTEIQATQICNDSGKTTGYVVTYRDVTDRERVEQALKDAETKYRTVADNTYDFEFWIDPKGKYLYASPSCQRITGYDRNEFLSNSTLRQKILHPSDKQRFIDHIESETSKKKAGELEFRIIHKDGSIRWIHHVCQPIYNQDGTFAGTRGSNRDITEHKKIQEDFLKQHDELQTIFDTVPASIFYKDTENRFIRVNKAFTDFMGLSKKNLEGKSLFDLFSKKQAQAYWDDDAEVIRSGRSKLNIVETAETKQGLRYVQTNKIPYRDASGNIIGVVGFTVDITERKQAEEQLRETKVYLENLLNYANAPIIVWDASFKIIRFNRAFERLTGYRSEDVMNKNLDLLFPRIHKKESLTKIKNTVEGEYWESVEIPILRKDGLTRIALWNSANIYDNERKTLIATIAQGQDITERKQAEESLKQTRDYLESLLDYANAPIIVWDADFKIIRFNNAFTHLTGYTADEVIGKKLDILFPKESKSKSLLRIKKTLGGEHWESVEIPILRKDKETRIALWNSANIYGNEKKDIIATIAQGQDITERKKTEFELQKLNEQLLSRTNELSAVNKELEGFSYSVSHDLRAPLRSIDGFSQALVEDYAEKLDEQGKDYIQRVRKAAQRMGQLIDDMLRLSRLARTDLALENVDVSSLARSITEKLEIANPSRTLRTDIQPKMTVKGDKRLLEILMENLLGNAWKFTSKVEQPAVKVGDLIKDGEHVFYVQDNGAGFDMAYEDKLFIPFQRLHSMEEYPGTGIGLALASQIVHRHGGRIWAEGEVGKGATFYFTLQKKE